MFIHERRYIKPIYYYYAHCTFLKDATKITNSYSMYFVTISNKNFSNYSDLSMKANCFADINDSEPSILVRPLNIVKIN